MKSTKFQKQKSWELSKELGNGLIQLGNISFAALMFGQAFGGFRFNFLLALLGIVMLVVFYGSAIIVMSKNQ